MSFVANLKQARATHSLTKSQEAARSSQFSIARAGEPVSRPAASFSSPVVEEEDPMFPRIRLVTRYMSREVTQSALPPQCETLTITDLLKQVQPPDFTRPVDTAPNFVVLGIVAKRSETKTSHRGQKYCTLLLSDLKYDISLALHAKAYERFWKVQPGTLIAVLNPRFWVQRSVGDSRTLALSIVDEKGVLEIGQAKDLGQCEEMTTQSKQTKRCKNWVDVRRTHVCEFHVEQRAARSKRPELNSASAKLWDPMHGGARRMSLFKGGDVAWKRGLQVDHQVGIPRAFRDAPVGNIFQSGGVTQSDIFDQSPDMRQRQRQREKRQLENITDDATLGKRLATGSRERQPAAIQKGATPSAQKPHKAQNTNRVSRSLRLQNTSKPARQLSRTYEDINGDYSDSDLEIVP